MRVDADLRPDIADRYGLGHWPSLLVLTPEGHVLTGGTHLHDALAARIRDAARAFSAHGGPWPSTLPAAPPDTDRPRRRRPSSMPSRRRSRRRATRGPGRACMTAGLRPAPPSSPWRTRQPAADADWASTAADTIDALHAAAPGLDDTGVVAFVTDADGLDPVARLEDQAEWVRVLARAVRLEPLPAWTSPARPAGATAFAPLSGATTGIGGHGRVAHALFWWMRAHGPVVRCSPRPTRSTARISPREAIEALEVLAPVAYSRGSGVSHTIADGHARGPVLLDDAMLLAHALLDADAWRDDPVYRDLAEELVRTSLARLQEPSGAHSRSGCGAGRRRAGRAPGRSASSTDGECRCRATPASGCSPTMPSTPRRPAASSRAVTPEALAAGTFGAPVGLAWHAFGPAGARHCRVVDCTPRRSLCHRQLHPPQPPCATSPPVCGSTPCAAPPRPAAATRAPVPRLPTSSPCCSSARCGTTRRIPQRVDNDRFILSKGHAAPLLYAAWAEVGIVSREATLTLRELTSDLEGHPTPRLPWVDLATGSLGQGLAAGVGMRAQRAAHRQRLPHLRADGRRRDGRGVGVGGRAERPVPQARLASAPSSTSTASGRAARRSSGTTRRRSRRAGAPSGGTPSSSTAMTSMPCRPRLPRPVRPRGSRRCSSRAPRRARASR